MRIAQWDILRFCIDPGHASPGWPEGYWPEGDAPPDPAAWDRTVDGFRADLAAMVDLVTNPETDLFARLAHGEGQTVLREALLVADHTPTTSASSLPSAGSWASGKIERISADSWDLARFLPTQTFRRARPIPIRTDLHQGRP